MFKKIGLIIIGIVFVQELQAKIESGIQFNSGVSWEQIKEKAKIENKYIFLDCFATWCGPCRKMDQEVYNTEEVGTFTDNHFIAVKVQLDSTKQDNEGIRSWYADAHAIMKEFNVAVFPTYLFLSPDGKIVHRGSSFRAAPEFIKLLQDAIDPERQYYTLLDNFYKEKLSWSKMPELIEGLERNSEKKAAKDVATSYINNYLLKLNDRELYTKGNLKFIGGHVISSQDPGFEYFYIHADKINTLVGGRFATKTIDFIIANEMITPILLQWDSLTIIPSEDREWNKISDNIRRKYNNDYAERNILNGQLRWYAHKHQWKELAYYNVKKITTYGLDTAGNGVAYTNNMIFSVIFMHSDDKATIERAIEWMKIICAVHPEEQDYLDTYANLLYKKGDVEAAIKLEEKAVSMNSRNSKEIIEGLEKMKRGEPTWSLN